MPRFARATVPFLAALLAAGCAKKDRPAAADTGARAAVRVFYEALIARDWPRAYAALHPDERARSSEEQFAARAQAHSRRFGFAPTRLTVRSCEEAGDTAKAHVIIAGAGPGKHEFRDALTLHKGPPGWGVVLPSTFGAAERP
jgi:hypothetical protein